MVAEPLETPSGPRRRLSDQRRERTPSGDRQDDQRLKRVDRVAVVTAVSIQRRTHVVLELTEHDPSVDHAGDVPFLWSVARFVEVLPDAVGEDVLEVRVAMDGLVRKRRYRQAARGVAKDLAGFATHELSDAERLWSRIEAS